MRKTAPYGSWPSPISADDVASSSVRLSEATVYENTSYWLEGRPSEKGRTVLVKQIANKPAIDLLNAPWSVSTSAHEYGGGAYCVGSSGIFFVNRSDQNIYWLGHKTQAPPIPITQTSNARYADLHYDNHHKQLVCVCEAHLNNSVENYLVSIACDTNLLQQPNYQAVKHINIIHRGHDFYSNPSVSPSGNYLSWLCWDHPNMPWDASQLFVSALAHDGTLKDHHAIAGHQCEQSLFQPQWHTDDLLFWVSDKNNWWNIYYQNINALLSGVEPIPLHTLDAEFASPQWVFGLSTYSFLNHKTVLSTYTRDGFWELGLIDIDSKQLTPIQSSLNEISSIRCHKESAVLIGASDCRFPAVYTFQNQRLSPLTECNTASEHYSKPQAFKFETTHNEHAYGFYYPPHNLQFKAEAEQRPPVIVLGHGGPTGSTSTQLNLKIQFWTSRGFAILDINYRGSTGFGRQYRHSLKNNWGIKDVDDLCQATNFAMQKGWVAPNKKIIKGSSAGGYSVLAALTFKDTFDVGVSLYGIGDLELLANDTHKFEERYLDSLIGPYPEEKSIYQQRSPIHYVKNIKVPVLIFQGGQDKVVPAQQAETIVQAVYNNGNPIAYKLYPDEGHGFRNAQTLLHMLNTELYFYRKIFKIPLTQEELPIEIRNLDI